MVSIFFIVCVVINLASVCYLAYLVYDLRKRKKFLKYSNELQETLGMEPVAIWDIIANGELGAMYAPLQICRWVVMRKLTMRERLRALFGKLVVVTESYPSEPVDAPKTYELVV